MASGVYIGTNVIFILFASGEPQPWNNYWEKGDGKDHCPDIMGIFRRGRRGDYKQM